MLKTCIKEVLIICSRKSDDEIDTMHLLPQVRAGNTKLSLSHRDSEIRQISWEKVSLLI